MYNISEEANAYVRGHREGSALLQGALDKVTAERDELAEWREMAESALDLCNKAIDAGLKVIDKMPQTMDRMPMYPGREVFIPRWYDNGDTQYVTVLVVKNWHHAETLSDKSACYSTYELAEDVLKKRS